MSERIRLFFECLTKWRYQESGDLAEAECIAIQDFGQGKEQTPGISNVALAKLALRLIKLKNFPIIAQQQTALVLDNCRNVIHIIESENYLNTWQVMQETAKVIKSRGFSKVIIIAHPMHVWRVNKHCQKLSLVPIIPYDLEKIPFDPASSQWWTRSAFLWIIRELPIRIYCLLRGYI